DEDGVLLIRRLDRALRLRDIAKFHRDTLVRNLRTPSAEELLQQRGNLRLVEIADDRDLRHVRAVEIPMKALRVLELHRPRLHERFFERWRVAPVALRIR